jgi:hypothetical protein
MTHAIEADSDHRAGYVRVGVNRNAEQALPISGGYIVTI